MTIGILSFQGDYYLHRKILNYMNVKSVYVNSRESLLKTDALIIPGGESTVISQFLIQTNLDKEIFNYSKSKNIFGTCAGSIIMSSVCNDKRISQLGIINIQAHRNAWGRQINSFEEEINLTFSKKKCKVHFIRAPIIKSLSKKNIILSSLKGEPILLRNNKHLISTFHPEINNNCMIHEYFLRMISE